jgi:predicted transport protein
VHNKLNSFHAGKEFFEIPLDEAKRAVDEAAQQVGTVIPSENPPTGERQFDEIDFSAPKLARPPVPFETHLPKTDALGREILLELREKALALGSDVSEKATTYNRIAYSRGRVFLEVKVHKNRVRILFLDIAFEDSRHLVQEVPKSYGWGRLKYLVNLRSLDDLAYAMPYIKASYSRAAETN